MCTVTWGYPGAGEAEAPPDGAGYYLFMNRDELWTRGEARPPRANDDGTTRFVAPRDADSNGTWIASNEHGLTVCLLNHYPPGAVNQPDPPDPGYTTRGELPLRLMSARTVHGAEELLAEATLTQYRPFTLFLIAPSEPPLVLQWGGDRIKRFASVRPPLVSSSFDSDRAARTRRQAYRQLVDTASPEALEHFHRSHEPARGPYSVCVHRDDGGSRSLTRVEVNRNAVRMTYEPLAPCEKSAATEVSVPLSSSGSSVKIAPKQS